MKILEFNKHFNNEADWVMNMVIKHPCSAKTKSTLYSQKKQKRLANN